MKSFSRHTTPTDRAIIKHIKALASMMKSRVVLLHVADGWAARTFRSRCGQPGDHGGQGSIWRGPQGI
jgi:hypothetical protein